MDDHADEAVLETDVIALEVERQVQRAIVI
jgi:hypothetical protein